jgi:3-hydroxybutyrate dehydrogenase
MTDDGMTLAGKVALVTGANGGLGRAIYDEMLAQGADVIGVDVAGEHFRADVSTAEGNREMVAGALERHGRLDVMVLNAGAQHTAPIAAFPEAEWDRLMDLMVKGPFLAIQAAWGALTERPGSRIIIIASTSSYVAEANKVAYVSAKHAVLGLVKTAAIEGASRGLMVNAVAPGWMRTPLAERQIAERVSNTGQSRDEVLDGMLDGQPVRRLIEPAEVARVVTFLASGRSGAITGTCIPVDLAALAV